MKETIAFPQLVELVAQKANTTERMSELFLQELFAVISQELTDGKSVKVNGLGTFKMTKVGSEKDVIFTPDKDLAEAVNAPFAQFAPVELCDDVTDEMLREIDTAMEQPAKDEIVATEPTSSDENAGATPFSSEKTPEQEEKTPNENVGMSPVSSDGKKQDGGEDVGARRALSAQEQQEQKDLQEEPVPQDIKSRNPRTWLIAAAAAIALIAVWYFFTHRSKERSDKAIETTQVAQKPSTSTKDNKTLPVVTDTIGGGNVIFTMAKKHYGDQAFWVYIARENQAQYPDYRKIKSGSVLVIPPAEKYGINSDSKQSLKQAGIEAMKLYKEVKAAESKNQPEDTTATKQQNQKNTNNKSYKSTRYQYHRNYSSHKRYHRRRR